MPDVQIDHEGWSEPDSVKLLTVITNPFVSHTIVV